jgi:hypothetical protein
MNRLRAWADESWFLARLTGPFWRLWYRLYADRLRRRQLEELRVAAENLYSEDTAH